MTRVAVILVTAMLCSLVMIGPVHAAMGDVVLSFNAKADCSTGLTWADGYLWNIAHGHNVPAKLHKLDPSNGNILLTYTLSIEHVMGLAWDGNSFWAVSHADSIIYQLNASDGSVMSSFPSPNPGVWETGCQGLAWDGAYLWYADRDLDTIFQLDTSDGSIINSFSSPGSHPQGLAWDGAYLWHFDYDTKLIYKLDPLDGTTVVSFTAPGNGEGDLAWDDSYLWLSRNVDDTIYKIDVGIVPPVADAGPDQIVYLGDEVQFNGSASYDPDGTIVTYEWDFDVSDGLLWDTGAPPDAFGPNPTYTYNGYGIFTATLRVTDNNGSMDADTCIITVLVPPPLPPILNINVSHDGEDVILYWDPPSIPGIDHYLIYRSTSQTGFDFNTVWVNTSSDNESGELNPIPLRTMWNDTKAALPGDPGYEEEYYYIVRAVNAVGEVSRTSRTVGKWTRTFPQGVSTFSLPLEPLGNFDTQWYTSNMNADYIKYMNTTTHMWVPYNFGDGTSNNTQMNLGEGYEVKFSSQTNYTFTGLPGAMIRYKTGGFIGFDYNTDAKNLSATVDAITGNVTLNWTRPSSMDGDDSYKVYRSTTRDGFDNGTIVLLDTLPYGNETYVDPGAELLFDQCYYMVIPVNETNVEGSSTYGIGVWTEEYAPQYDTFSIPLKMDNYETADWYCDNISETVGMNHYNISAQRWGWHSTFMPAGAYDPILLMTEGYQISTSDTTKFTFTGV